jgi:dTDP-4-amino-4,6-dideoxygalactose transaminase
MASPQIRSEEEQLVLSVLRSGQLAQGPMVDRFEQLCASMAGTTDAVAMSNGTLTLEASLAVLGIGPGDEVITSPITFGATLNAILRSGAIARFADVTPDYTLDPESIASLVGPATAAVVPVHLYGLPADMPAIAAIAARHGLAVVEDAAQAHGASIDGRPVGSFGLGSFSFYATKNVTTGEGGAVTTSDPAYAGHLRLLRNQGMRQPYRFEIVGTNMRMTDLQAALGIPQLQRLEEIRAVRAANAEALGLQLGERVPSVVLPPLPVGRRHAWHLYTVLLPGGTNRDVVRNRMRERGVETAVHYPALVWDHPPYHDLAEVAADQTPTALNIASRCLSLPIRPGLDSSDLERVASALDAALD